MNLITTNERLASIKAMIKETNKQMGKIAEILLKYFNATHPIPCKHCGQYTVLPIIPEPEYCPHCHHIVKPIDRSHLPEECREQYGDEWTDGFYKGQEYEREQKGRVD